MDSVTQLALGAAVGHATLGRPAARRALLWGAALGTLPDLDILVPLGDAIADFTYHRSWSHSVFVLGALAPAFGWLAARLHGGTPDHRAWTRLAGLVFVTHVLLDCLTVYGTQIFWPLPVPPVMWSTIFIVDPGYTLPLLAGITLAWLRVPRANAIGLALSTLYLAWGVAAKLHVDAVVRAQLPRAPLVLTTPTPFNSLLWRVVVVRDDGWSEGYYSLVADDRPIALADHPSRADDAAALRGIPSFDRLAWFTRGFFAVTREGSEVVFTDLRMGSHPDFVFRFVLARADGAEIEPTPPRQRPSRIDWSRVRWVWERMWRADA